MKCFGSSTSFVSVLCTYGYSFTIFLPVILACSIPIDLMQWILLSYAVGSSTSFILVNFWKELSKYMEKKRYLLMIIIIICQAGLFAFLRFYFFDKFTEATGTAAIFNNSSTNSTSNNTTVTAASANNTLLFY